MNEFVVFKKIEIDRFESALSDLRKMILNIDSTSKLSWLSEPKAMQLLDVSKSTIQRYRKNGLLPFSQYANKIMYKHSDIMAFLEANYSGNSSFSLSKSEAA